MNKTTLNIISVCIVSLIIVFSVKGNSLNKKNNPNNILVKENEGIVTKADKYQENILQTITDQNIKKFTEFTKTFEKASDDTLTESLSKDIFSQYIKYNVSGEIEQDDILSATQNILSIDTNIKNPVSYNDIKIVPSTMTNLKTYGNNLAIIQNGINKGVESLSNKKDKTPYISSIYMKTSELLTITVVPESLAENHINLINGFKKYSEGLNMLNEQATDPAKSLLGVKKLKEATDEIYASLDKIKQTIDLNKVTYLENEPGYILNK